MLHEEFVKFSKVHVSYRYYKEKVEPLYAEGNPFENKDEWCTDWVKKNKSNIVKAHEFDIDALSRDISLKDCFKSDNQRLKEELVAAKEKVTAFELELDSLRKHYQALESKATALEEELDTLTDESEQLKAAIEAIDEKDNEIIKLKAQLYDMMMKAV